MSGEEFPQLLLRHFEFGDAVLHAAPHLCHGLFERQPLVAYETDSQIVLVVARQFFRE